MSQQTWPLSHDANKSSGLCSEAATHSARCYLHSLAPGHVMVKLDFANAFNSLHRSDMLLSVRKLTRVVCLLPLIVLTAIILVFWISCHSVPGGPTTR